MNQAHLKKTGIDEGVAETFSLDILYLRIYTFCCDHAYHFSFCHHRKFFRADTRGKYDYAPVPVLGGLLVLFNIHLFQKDI
jgi:hypothetical protein